MTEDSEFTKHEEKQRCPYCNKEINFSIYITEKFISIGIFRTKDAIRIK